MKIVAVFFSLLLIPATISAQDGVERDQHQMHRLHSDPKSYIGALEDPKRDAYQKPQEVMVALDLKPGKVIADIGAGSGYFTFRLAHHVGDRGKVYAVDVSPDMIRHINRRIRELKATNVVSILADPDDPARSQAVSPPNHLAKLRAAEKRTGKKVRKEDIREAITASVRREVEAGRVRDQAGVVRYPGSGGHESCTQRRRGRWWPAAAHGCRAGPRRLPSRPHTAAGTPLRRERPGSGAGTAELRHPRAELTQRSPRCSVRPPRPRPGWSDRAARPLRRGACRSDQSPAVRRTSGPPGRHRESRATPPRRVADERSQSSG